MRLTDYVKKKVTGEPLTQQMSLSVQLLMDLKQ